ncbi:PEPxxWA-CTERM sorting domain-containing protein [Sandarakinorhabdus sp.]|uniref:PEPxxWA-CTERM sorting domain-containing protein n=1 Tax=Sandarakinorhabdus sp. TaxID=1916663 RepID=UPI00333FB49A
MMANLFPTLSGSLTTEMNNQLNALTISAAVRATSKAFGQSVANNFFNARLTDGASVAQVPYTPGMGLGDFQPTNANPPVLPLWGNVTTFAATSATQFSPGAPPVVGSAEWIADYESVRLLGCATCGTPEQQTIAKFWADGGGTFTPPGHWLDITNGLLTTLPILEAARLSALVGMAVADAGITAWNIKYDFNTMRPITAINTCTVGTCGVAGEPGWVPLLGTPNFPSYTSGHSTFSGGAAGAIAGFFGTDNIAFCTPADPASGVVGNRCYTSLSQAATEAGDSRIFGGIHFEHDNARAVTKGIELGQHVAATQLQFQGAVPEPSSWAMLIAGFGLIGATLRRRRAVATAA